MTNPSELLRRYFEAYNAHDASGPSAAWSANTKSF